MANTNETIERLSPEAVRVIETAGRSQTGVVIEMPVVLVRELELAGVVGAGGGLTVHGSGVAERLQAAYLDRLFG